MMKPDDPKHYDAVVIGSGQGGNPLCEALAGAGLRTALIEREHLGGTCINEGCTPSKTMVASGRVAYLARRAADYGVDVGELRIDMARVRARKRAIVERFRKSRRERIGRTANLELILGEASFAGPKLLSVRPKEGAAFAVSAERIFINAGCRPAVPEIPGLRDVPFLDSTSIMELGTVPKQLLILGGGYVGLEFGQLFRRLGSEVTIVARSRLLSGEDADVCEGVKTILEEDGVRILLGATAENLARQGSRIQLTAQASGRTETLEGTHLLVATGRVPNTEALNLPAAGVAADARGYLKVDDALQTSVKGIYALGDVKGGPAFTHISYDDFRILKANLLDGGKASTTGRLVPYTVFIDPALGRVGPTEERLRAQGRKIKVAKMPMSYVARALETDEARGFLKAVVDAESGQILSGAILGVEGGEVMSQLQIAMMGGLPFQALRDGVFAHPNLSEAFNNLFADL